MRKIRIKRYMLDMRKNGLDPYGAQMTGAEMLDYAKTGNADALANSFLWGNEYGGFKPLHAKKWMYQRMNNYKLRTKVRRMLRTAELMQAGVL